MNQDMTWTTFQHIGTSRTRDDAGHMVAILYGRQADGKSVAVSVRGLEAYGYLYHPNLKDITFDYRLRQIIQWTLSMTWHKRAMKKYKEENENMSMDISQEFSRWKRAFEGFSKVEHNDIRWCKRKGFNIRRVHDGNTPGVFEFRTKKYNVWSDLIKLLRKPGETYDAVRLFRRKMVNIAEDLNKDVPGLPGDASMMIGSELYETMFKPEFVWMVDHKLPACSWMTVHSNAPPVLNKNFFCDRHVITHVNGVVPCDSPPIPMAPFRTLSYDIEAVPYVNPEGECEFPDPKRDPISTIGIVVFDMVSQKMKQIVLMYEPGTAKPCTGLPPLPVDMRSDEFDPSTTIVHSFSKENEMLAKFAQLVREEDVDVITGYNVLNFDNVYLVKRIRTLCGCEEGAWCTKCASARTFSRIPRATTLRKKYTFSKQRGGQESWEASIVGRDWMDVYRTVQTDHKLGSYKLDNVCEALLGTKKIHISYEDIPKHQKTSEGRMFLAQYCVKDAWLPCQIIVRRAKLINAIQMSQVTGVPLTEILHRGQQIRTLSLMLQFAKERCRRDPTHPRWFLPDESANKPPPSEGFEGAVVIRPLPGFYRTPVVTLDFASLYPSIMRAYNMCFSTLVPSLKQARRLQLKWSPEIHDIKNPEDPNYPEVRPVRSFDYPEGGRFEYVTRDTDVCFVTSKKRVGILPEILAQLLNNRKLVKKERKKYSEKSMEYAVLDGRQLALKVCANSVYGFTGAGMGYLGEKRIASSVTRVGRGMANHTKFMCEDKYKEYGLQIVYGDTDSVFANIPESMCDTNCTTKELIARVDKIGTEMGKFCTKAFLPPNDLEYEKFYYPILLKGKKRYAGHKFEPGLAPKLDVKGFECVRRDFAPIVSKTQKEVLIRLCKKNDVQGAIDYAREQVVKLLQNKVPIEDLTMSKQLTRKPEHYKNPAPHTELAKRLQATQPAHIAPKTGDRIPFLIRPGFKGEKMCFRAVTPEDVEQERAQADTRWYLSNQLRKPLQRIFEMIMDNSSEIFEINCVRNEHSVKSSIMRNFVQHSQTQTHKKRTRKSIQFQKKKKPRKQLELACFFNKKK